MDRKNLLKAGRRSSMSLNVSSRSLNASRTQAIAESSNYCLENYGTSLPVAVIEMIGSSERKTECSVTLSDDGWGWFVSGRHLVIWKFAKTVPTSRKGGAVATPKSYELTLPPSDLAHKADLVAVFCSEADSLPSCLAVSPEGTVRYWSSVSHENSFVEVSADLQGQECDLLSEAMPLGFLVATTTASVLLITPKVIDGHPRVQCRAFKTPQGLLGSIGRRMSSLIFGPLPTQSTMETRLVKLLTEKQSSSTVNIQVLCSQHLQHWQICDGMERLLYQCDADKLARESFITHIWSRDSISIHQLRIWMLDAHILRGDLMILVAAANPSMNHNGQVQVQYALATLPLSTLQAPLGFSSFCVLKFASSLSANEDTPQCRFLVIGATAYLYTDKWVLCVPANEPLEEPERLEVRGPNERILGAGMLGNNPPRPVLFSTRHGVLLLNSTSPEEHPSFLDDSVVLASSESMAHPAAAVLDDSIAAVSSDSASAKLKSAFFHFCRKNVFETQSLLDELFAPASAKNDVDSLLDRLVLELSIKIVDDYPASDPRWTDSVPAGHESTFATVSLLVLHQLEDKVKAHDLFLTFLRNMTLWSDLTAVSERRGTKSTAFALLEHAEKLRSSLALRALHVPGSTLIDAAIRRILQERDVDLSNDKLTQQDLFYRHVSALGDFFAVYVDVTSEAASAQSNPAERVRLIAASANNVIAMLNAARDYRARNLELMEQCEMSFEMLPWVSAPGPRSVRSAVTRLVHVIVEEGVANADDAAIRSGLWSQASQLTDLLLDSFKTHADSVENPVALGQIRQDVGAERSALLELFLRHGELERAAVLAEKYVDFNALLTVCDRQSADPQAADAKLNEYIDKLGDSGFTEFACKWYMQRNQREKLLRLRRPEVTAFLELHPDLLWVDQSERESYLEAGRTLVALADAEKDRFSRKRTLLSLAKLHLILEEKLGPDPEVIRSEIDQVDAELQLLLHQEQLPLQVLQAYGLDPDTMRVLTPEELVEMYISDENTLANELDFKKGLDLLSFVDDAEQRDALRARVWARAILRDPWTQLDTDDVLQSIRSTLFYRVIDFSMAAGEDVGELLPNADELLAEPQLAELAENAVFKFLLRAVYEHVRSLIQDDSSA